MKGREDKDKTPSQIPGKEQTQKQTNWHLSRLNGLAELEQEASLDVSLICPHCWLGNGDLLWTRS